MPARDSPRVGNPSGELALLIGDPVSTPETPSTPLSATQTAETPSAGVSPRNGPRWALYMRSGGAAPPRPLPGMPDNRHEGVEKQRVMLHDLVAARGGTVVAEFVDYGPAGGPELRAMLAAGLAGRYDRIAAVDLERLARKPDAAEAFLRDLLDVGAGLTLAMYGPEPQAGGTDIERTQFAVLANILQGIGRIEETAIRTRARAERESRGTRA